MQIDGNMPKVEMIRISKEWKIDLPLKNPLRT
jgi:hypothetical protein